MKTIFNVFQFSNGVLVCLSERRNYGEPVISYKWSIDVDQQSFTLEHGSLLLMSGYTQRDWVHSGPKCADAAGSTRISLTFGRVLGSASGS